MLLHEVLDCTCSWYYTFEGVIILSILFLIWVHLGNVQFHAIMNSVAAMLFMAVHVIWSILRYEESSSGSICMLSFSEVHQLF